MLSTKEGKKAWVEPVIDAAAPDGYRFQVRTGTLSRADEERLTTGTKTPPTTIAISRSPRRPAFPSARFQSSVIAAPVRRHRKLPRDDGVRSFVEAVEADAAVALATVVAPKAYSKIKSQPMIQAMNSPMVAYA
jgi:hypothetical protein